MSKWVVDIHGEIEGDYDIIKKYEEPKTGYWINKYHEVFKYYCDKCGTGSDLRTQYCPNCGAKMKSEG